MAKWRGIVGKSFSPDAFEEYVASLKFGAWRPRFIVVHNTSAPDTATWQGWQKRKPPVTDERWAQNLVGYYRDQEHWAAGPHLFVTPKGILVFTPLNVPGTHSPAWNSITWGVETVGEFERDAFEGPIRDNLVAALAILHASAGLSPQPYERGVRGLHFHKEDPITTHKACPGKNIVTADLVAAVEREILRRHGGGGHPHTALLETDDFTVGDNEAAPVPAPVAIAAVPGDPELYSVQSRLKALNYSAGVLDGKWGGGTSGAISAFINDRGGHIAVPASLEAFNAERENIKAELQAAESANWKRPVTEARASADAATVAAVAPEVVPVKRNMLVTAWGAAGTFLYGVYNSVSDSVSQAWDFFTSHKDDLPSDPGFLSNVWEHVQKIPTPFWIFAAAAGLLFVAMNSHAGVKKITEQVKTGARQ